MYLQKIATKKSVILNIAKSFRKQGAGTSSVIVERLGNADEIKKREGCEDPIAWAQLRVDELNRQERDARQKILLPFSPNSLVPLGKIRTRCAGDLFLRKYYHRFGLDGICKDIAGRRRFKYDLDAILQKLVYSRVLTRGSKLATFNGLGAYLDKSPFELEDVYRSLSVLADESEAIQAGLFKNSEKARGRDTSIIYYDCTNYFFEIDEEDDFRKYGKSKEHRPNPIVQLGLFMDREGIPLSFCLNAGNTAETGTLLPLEDTMAGKFGVDGFIVCTDAGLSSTENRKANRKAGRDYITVGSLKKAKEHIQAWALSSDGWRVVPRRGDGEDISRKEFSLEDVKKDEWLDRVFYKERWVNENDLEERMIVTYSYKFDKYAKALRAKHVARAEKMVEGGRAGKPRNQNDPRRFIVETYATQDGEVAELKDMGIDAGRIEQEEKFDGFYCLLTSLEGKDFPADYVFARNKFRYHVEALFRVTKTELKARPVFLQVRERIIGHFIVCFIALMLLRVIQLELDDKEKKEARMRQEKKKKARECLYSVTEIRETLARMMLTETQDGNFIPAYDRTQLTDDLHALLGLRTDTQIVPKKRIRDILRLVNKG